MIAIFTLLVIVILSLLVVRIATVALTLTGLSRELARFQARSAFTGSGFTTNESERVVDHPVRRRVIMLLMLVGNAGLITAVSTLILSFVTTDDQAGLTDQFWFRVLLLAIGLMTLWLVAHSQWVDRRMSQVIAWALSRWTDLEIRDYAALLHLSGDYAVAEMAIQRDDWMAGCELSELKLVDEGILALAIQKANGGFLGAPRGNYRLDVDDTVIFYGPRSALAELDNRKAGTQGNWRHHVAVEKQVQVKSKEEQQLAAATGDDVRERDGKTPHLDGNAVRTVG
ncbi:MAG: potassium transporter TrkA [Planctomycetota bacterium]|nr:MAG: potassium transporter TrkA [Planctomycetota bacterium]REJ88577.1 MAG: potassium transporter TrkA [Planctomycetota bacterium]REK17549.1 MAG: potassium transporter TrkA [Planctomycetota bacterium]REK47458.1 MAG: potassium transporter TrkA [Planctomycetota bacterium]